MPETHDNRNQLDPRMKRMAELLHAEVTGRLHACEHLESEFERIRDPRVLYGWSLLTQEVLIRLAEATLKLLHLIHFGRPAKWGHGLGKLWAQLPKSVQDRVNARRRDFPGGESGVSFMLYDEKDFKDVRYSYEADVSGKMRTFEIRRLFLDSYAAAELADEWLGDIPVWPYAGLVNIDLTGLRILPLKEGRFEVILDEPVEAMDWAGATIEPKGDCYVWTLYCGYVGRSGEACSFEIPSLLYPWPIQDLLSSSVDECIEMVCRAYAEPCHTLLMAIDKAKAESQTIS